MKTMLKQVYTITRNDTKYRFVEVLNHDNHFSGYMLTDKNKQGKMLHRITNSEMEQATVTTEQVVIWDN